MAEVTILTETELRQCVALDGAAVDIVEQAFAALARGRPSGGRRFQQPLRLLQPFAEAFRLVAPGLTQHIRHQRIAHDLS